MIDRLLARLKKEKASYSIEALSKPVNKDSFEYGVHHGVIKGLSFVEKWIDELLEEEEGDENE